MFNKLKEYYNKKSTGSITHLVVALGNPGKEYENTRHNAGWLALDYILKEENIELKKLRFNALCNDVTIGGARVLFMKPQTYMNKSGEAVIQAMQFYKISAENVLVICDDVTRDLGKLRIRRQGSDGGQNGLKNIIRLAGSDFPRIRIGIGQKPHPQMDLADWVISKFTQQELEMLKDSYKDIYKAVELIISGDLDGAMNRFN